MNVIEVNDWLKPTFKKAIFDDKKDGFRRKLFLKAAEMDNDVIEKMKARIQSQGMNVCRELASVVGVAKPTNPTTKITELTDRDSLADLSKNKSSHK